MDRLLLALLSLYMAWRFCKMTIDPDWALFNMAAFTGAWWGRDFVDCKMPTIHLWYYAIAKLVGTNVVRIRFVHHLLVSAPGVIIGGWAGLAFIVMVNSGWLIAFHGNVGQQPAGAILLALYWNNPWLSTALVFLAIAFEPKLVTVLLVPILSGWWLPLLAGLAISAGLALAIRILYPVVWGWLVEANLVITKRMAQQRWKNIRRGGDPTLTSMQGILYVMPWTVLAVYTNPDWRYWLPAAAYIALSLAGGVMRSNHVLVLAPWIALVLPWQGAIALFISDWVSGFAYIGNLWGRFYHGLMVANMEAQVEGNFLKGKPGTLWVNGIHSAVYIHAGKPPFGGMTEQIEIRDQARERRLAWRSAWKKEPPYWVVQAAGPGWDFTPIGYHLEASTDQSKIYRRL